MPEAAPEPTLKSTRRSAPHSGISAAVRAAIHSRIWLFCVDMYPMLVAASIPWSTSGVAIFMVIWFIVLIPTLEPLPFLHSLKRPASLLPLALVALAMIGTLWADGPWSVRLHGINPVTKLLAIPFLLYHFERSQRGLWVLLSFLASCALLMGCRGSCCTRRNGKSRQPRPRACR